MQNIREYFMKKKPGVNRKDRERTDEKNLNSDKDNIEKDMGEGEKRKKFFKVKIDLMKQKKGKE